MNYSSTTILLLQTCLRLIQQEFNLRLRLDDEQVITMILAYSAQSKSTELKQNSEKLSRSFLLQQTNSNSQQSTDHHQIYRGQKIENEKFEVPVNQPSTERTIIYRGQKMTSKRHISAYTKYSAPQNVQSPRQYLGKGI